MNPLTPSRLRGGLRRIRRLTSSSATIWQRGLSSEVGFWEQYFRTEGREYPEGYRQRRDPNAPISDPLLLQAIDRTSSNPVRILDVGAGPLTAVGRHDPRDPRRQIQIVATDPLAHEYDRLLEQFEITPPVRTAQCRGEELVSAFGAGAFDIAHARNSIDHSANPLVVIENMAAAVGPGGSLVLHHYRREGEKAQYANLHQWNFDVEQGRLMIWGRRQTYDVATELGRGAAVTAWTQLIGGQEWVHALIAL